MSMTKRCFPLAALVVSALVVSGCATTTGRSPAPAGAVLICHVDALAGECLERVAETRRSVAEFPAMAEFEREAGLPVRWWFEGRAAISHDGKGGSLKVEWKAIDHQRAEIVLSAPVTRQSWRLLIEPGHATLSGLPGGPRSGPDAQVLLREATGFEIPVDAMRSWVAGMPASTPEPVLYGYDRASKRLVALEQAGWRIDYLAFNQDGWPMRINAKRGGDQVRLVIDAWNRENKP